MDMDMCDMDPKELSSPVQYPKLPMEFPFHASTNRIQAGPSLFTTHDQDDCSVTSIKSSTGRRRAHKISDLISSPPRASHATQISRHFTESAVTAACAKPQLKREDSRHSFHGRSGSASPGDRNEQEQASPHQTPERSYPLKTHLPQLDGAHSVPLTPVRISSLRGPAPSFTPRSGGTPKPNQRTPSRASSSDSWTGDDEFLPPRPRLRENKYLHEQERLQRHQQAEQAVLDRQRIGQGEQDALLDEQTEVGLDASEADSASERQVCGDYRSCDGKPGTPAVDEVPEPVGKQSRLKSKNSRFSGRSASPKKKKSTASICKKGTASIASAGSRNGEKKRKGRMLEGGEKRKKVILLPRSVRGQEGGKDSVRGIDMEAEKENAEW